MADDCLDVDWYWDKVKYAGTHYPTRLAVARTLARLPERDAQWALNCCVFASVGGEIAGYALSLRPWADPGRRRPTNVIILSEPAMEESADALYVVAHEIAHARLGHPERTPFSTPEEGTEEAADALAAKWGFRQSKEERG